MENQDLIMFNKLSCKRHLNLNKLMKEHFSKQKTSETIKTQKLLSPNIEFSQMSDLVKTMFFLENQTRLLDTEEFLSRFKSFEEPKIDII
jgi:hypothetical protein